MAEKKQLLKVTGVPVEYARNVRRGAEADARAREYKAGQQQRKEEQLRNLWAANAARGAANRAKREAEKRKPKRAWDNYEEVAFIQKSAKLSFLIAACTRDGFRCVTIREFYHRQRDDQWVPTKNGVMIPLVSPITRTKEPDPNNLPRIIYPMQEFMSALVQAVGVAQEMELADPENAVWLKYPTTEEEQK